MEEEAEEQDEQIVLVSGGDTAAGSEEKKEKRAPQCLCLHCPNTNLHSVLHRMTHNSWINPPDISGKHKRLVITQF